MSATEADKKTYRSRCACFVGTHVVRLYQDGVAAQLIPRTAHHSAVQQLSRARCGRFTRTVTMMCLITMDSSQKSASRSVAGMVNVSRRMLSVVGRS